VSIANHWLPAGIPADVFTKTMSRGETKKVTSILQYPPWWKNGTDERLSEIIRWQRASFFPKHHLEIPVRNEASFTSISKRVADPQLLSIISEMPFVHSQLPAQVDVVEQRNGYLKINVSTSSDNEIAVMNLYLPDWQATVQNSAGDVVPAKILPWKVTAALSRIRVPSGKSTVELFYRPVAFYRGAWISGFSWVILVLLVILWPIIHARKMKRLLR